MESIGHHEYLQTSCKTRQTACCQIPSGHVLHAGRRGPDLRTGFSGQARPGRYLHEEKHGDAEMDSRRRHHDLPAQGALQLRADRAHELYRPARGCGRAQPALPGHPGAIDVLFHEAPHGDSHVPDHQRRQFHAGDGLGGGDQPFEGFVHPGLPDLCHFLPGLAACPRGDGDLPADDLSDRDLRTENEKRGDPDSGDDGNADDPPAGDDFRRENRQGLRTGGI